MTFEKALEAMKQGKKAKPKTDKFAYEIHNGKILLADEYASFIDVTNIPVELLFAEWEICEPEKKINPDAFKSVNIEPGKAFTDLWFVKANQHTEEYAKQIKEKLFEAYKLEPHKEDPSMYTDLEITFKSGDTITYSNGEWDDYSYDGNAVSVKKDGAWVGIYNFDNVFSVELKK